jgi:dienelactone hydrolase
MHAALRSVLTGAVLAGFATAAAADARISTVTLKAPDGVQLKGTYYAAEKPGPGLLLLHQCNADRTSWTTFATAAAARGFHVLTLDYRGFGESEGPRFDNFQNQQATIRDRWPADIDTAFTFLTTREGVDKTRIGAAGASCGVNQATQLARRHPEVRTVVLLSGGLEPNAREYIRNTPALSLLSVGSVDDGNIVPAMRWITGWSGHPASKFIEYKAAGHGTEMFAVEAGLQPLMLDWFETHLVKQGPGTAQAAAAPKAKTVVDEFWTALAAPGGVQKAREIYDRTRKTDKTTVLFPETELNQFGYQLLQENRAKDAILVFRMNVDEYPASGNTYDSLSDAYLADGNTADALRFAEKALEVLAKDTTTPEDFKQQVRESALGKIKQLKKQ